MAWDDSYWTDARFVAAPSSPTCPRASKGRGHRGVERSAKWWARWPQYDINMTNSYLILNDWSNYDYSDYSILWHDFVVNDHDHDHEIYQHQLPCQLYQSFWSAHEGWELSTALHGVTGDVHWESERGQSHFLKSCKAKAKYGPFKSPIFAPNACDIGTVLPYVIYKTGGAKIQNSPWYSIAKDGAFSVEFASPWVNDPKDFHHWDSHWDTVGCPCPCAHGPRYPKASMRLGSASEPPMRCEKRSCNSARTESNVTFPLPKRKLTFGVPAKS